VLDSPALVAKVGHNNNEGNEAMTTTTTTASITPRQIDEVLARISTTGKQGASHDQVEEFIVRVCHISGSRLGYALPWTKASINDAIQAVYNEAWAQGFRCWTERAYTRWATLKVAK